MQHAPRLPTGGQVLDLACGNGRHTRYLHAQGHSVIAADKNLGGVQDLEKVSGVTLLLTDLEIRDWPFQQNQFSGIIVTNYLYRAHFPHLADSLAPNGLLIFETFAAGNEKYGRPSNPAYLLEPDELLHAFADSLEVLAFEQTEERMPVAAVRQRICARRR
jgi:SAM-dependent methyltransferase